MIPDVLQALRSATSEAHRRLDTGLDLPRRLAKPSDRRAVAGRFYGFQAGLERAMGDRLSGVEGLRLDRRRRAHRFAADLAALGGPPPARLPVCAATPAACAGEALGLLYVLEGSTLGGKVIRRQLAAAGQAPTGLGFLDPYGAETGEMWRGFLTVLGREGAGRETEVVRGGVEGFRLAEAWLCGAEAGA